MIPTQAEIRRQERHQEFVKHAARTGYRRTRAAGYASRYAEREVRKRSLAFVRWARYYDWTWEACAELLGINLRTLKQWQQDWDEGRLHINPLGKPGFAFDPNLQKQIIDQIMLHGPGIGLRSLKQIFPEVPRSILQRILREIRWNLHEDETRRCYNEIIWHKPGTVWAIDYTYPVNPVDLTKRAILTVRDMASQCILLFEACEKDDAETTAFHLRRLIRRYGAPLVLKADNGPHFIGKPVSALLQEFEIIPLFSPAYTPKYNGSVEADQGSLKSRAMQLAARDGDPDHWTSSHLEGAVLWRNNTNIQTAKRTATEVFENRSPITPELRARFQRHVEGNLQRIATEAHEALKKRRSTSANQGQHGDIACPADNYSLHSDAVHRRAVATAMSDCSLYTTRRRLVRLPIPARIRA